LSRQRSVLQPLFALVCLGILYGSLFPFWFTLPVDETVWAGFLASWREVNSIGDILGNLVLFFPYGYLACLLAARGGARGALALALGGVLLSAACQLGQLFTPGRDPSIFDFYVNVLGGALGWLTGRVLPLGGRGEDTARHLPLVIAGFWLASQLVPFVPSLDPQAWREALFPLWPLLRFSWQACLVTTLSWLVFLHLLAHWAGLRLRGTTLVAGALAVLTLQLVIIENHLSLTAVVSVVLALVLWPAVNGRVSGVTLGWGLCIAFAVDAIGPLHLREESREFGWLPFIGYLQGSMLVNAQALCRKIFVFGAVALLLVAGRPPAAPRVLAIALGLLLIEWVQRYVGAGTPALTDPLLFPTMAWLITRYSETRGNAHP